jgi:hypothetical protein
MMQSTAEGEEASRMLEEYDDAEEVTGRTEVTVNLQHPSQPEIQIKESEPPSKKGTVIHILTTPLRITNGYQLAGFAIAAALVAFLAMYAVRLF